MAIDETDKALAEAGLVQIAQLVDRMFWVAEMREAALSLDAARGKRGALDGKPLRPRAAA